MSRSRSVSAIPLINSVPKRPALGTIAWVTQTTGEHQAITVRVKRPICGWRSPVDTDPWRDPRFDSTSGAMLDHSSISLKQIENGPLPGESARPPDIHCVCGIEFASRIRWIGKTATPETDFADIGGLGRQTVQLSCDRRVAPISATSLYRLQSGSGGEVNVLVRGSIDLNSSGEFCLTGAHRADMGTDIFDNRVDLGHSGIWRVCRRFRLDRSIPVRRVSGAVHGFVPDGAPCSTV